MLHTLPTGKGAIWSSHENSQDTPREEKVHLFVWAHDTNKVLNGRHLIYSKGVDLDGGDK